MVRLILEIVVINYQLVFLLLYTFFAILNVSLPSTILIIFLLFALLLFALFNENKRNMHRSLANQITDIFRANDNAHYSIN